MKRVISMAAAMVLAALLTACANTVADVTDAVEDTRPFGQTEEWRGNVSTTDDGRINGTNRTLTDDDDGTTRRSDDGRRSTDSRRAPRRTRKPLTDAMGAGMQA